MRLATPRSLLAAAGLALAFVCGAANAQITLFPNTLVEDDDIDTMSLDANGDGMLDVGDRLLAIIDFGQIISIPPGSAYDPMELTGITEIEVIGKTDLGGGQFRLDFGTSAAFTATYGAGAMIALFEDPANNLNLAATCLSVAGCTANATDGTLWAVMGFGDADDEWFSIGSDNVSAASLLGAATKVATVNYALSVLVNNTGYSFGQQAVPCVIGFACAGDGMTQVVGSADILGGQGLDPEHVRSDADFTLAVAVPEPASLALVGLALLGAGMTTRRRKGS